MAFLMFLKRSPAAILAIAAIGLFIYVKHLQSSVERQTDRAEAAELQAKLARQSAEKLSKQFEILTEAYIEASQQSDNRNRAIASSRDACLDQALPFELLD